MLKTHKLLTQADFPAFIWRPAVVDDAQAFHRLSLATFKADGMEAAQTVAEFELILQFLEYELEEDTLVAFTETGKVAALGFVFLPPGSRENNVRVGGNVHTAYRGRGLGTFLLSWGMTRAKQKLAEIEDDRPKILQTNCRDHHRQRIALFERNGFKPVRYFYKMDRDLSAPLPQKQLPPSLTLTTFKPELSESTRLAFNESFQDHWGSSQADGRTWENIFIGKPDFRADLSYLAVDESGKVVGFNMTAVSEERNRQAGKAEGLMDIIGVLRPWRKKGVASALIAIAMQGYKEAGLAYATLGVDTENPTGALRLYENLGVQAVQRSVSFQMEVT